MEYKELIDVLRNQELRVVLEYIDDAATAIETLLAERNAAIKSLHGRCGECKHHESGTSRFPCDACSIRGTGLIDRWQWRGPQKEDGGDDQTPEPTLERRSTT